MSGMVAQARPTLTEIGARTFTVIEPGVCYQLGVPGAELAFTVDRLSWRYNELQGELSVSTDLLGTDAVDGMLSVATFNLSSARARTERASQLEKQSRTRDIPWHPLVEELCQRVLAAERTGEPAIALRDIKPGAHDQSLVRVFGFLLPFRHHSIIFGDGGGTKSLLALYLAGQMAKDGYRVLIADWELDGVDHRERYETLYGEQMPATVFYTKCLRPFVHEIDRIKRIIRTQGIQFAFYDSVGFACHSKPEDADSALTYMRAGRQTGIGGLHIAHINRKDDGDQKPFGSAFFHNSARATWFIKPTEDTSSKTVGVFNRKHNIAKYRQDPFAYEVTVDGDRTAFRLTEIAAVSELSGQVPLSQRLKSYLKGGARSREEIAEEFADAKADTLRRTIDREIKNSRLVEFPNAAGDKRIGLASRFAS